MANIKKKTEKAVDEEEYVREICEVDMGEPVASYRMAGMTAGQRRAELRKRLTRYARESRILPWSSGYLSLGELVDLIELDDRNCYCKYDWLCACVELAEVAKARLRKALSEKRVELIRQRATDEETDDFAVIKNALWGLDDSWVIDSVVRGECKVKKSSSTDAKMGLRESLNALDMMTSVARRVVGDDLVDAVLKEYRRIIKNYE